MLIREASRQDVPILVGLIRESFRDVAEAFALTAENCPTHPSNCTGEWIEKALAKGVRYFLLEVDGQPAGCVAMERAHPGVCYLERLAVPPSWRRQGLGEALVRHVFAQAVEGGAPRVEIGIIAEQERLEKWYQGLGFATIRTVKIEHLPFDVTFMAIDL